MYIEKLGNSSKFNELSLSIGNIKSYILIYCLEISSAISSYKLFMGS